MEGEYRSWIGGSSSGGVRSTFPLSRLRVSRDELKLSTFPFSRCSFKPDQVVSITKHAFGGIYIRHNVPDLPKRLIFRSIGSAERIIEQIRRIGFIPMATEESIPERSGMALRWQAIVLVALWCNVLLGTDQFILNYGRSEVRLGILSITALASIFFLLVSVWRVDWVRQFLIKPGRSPNEIKDLLILVALITGIMSAFMIYSALFGH